MTTLKPPVVEGEAQQGVIRSLLHSFVDQLRYLVFGAPKGRNRGRWVYNTRDRTWRYYVDDVR